MHSLRWIRRTAGLLLLAAVAAVAIAACGSSGATPAGNTTSSNTTSSGGTPVRGGNLTIGFDLNVQNCIDPNQAFGLEQRDLDRNLVDSLTDQVPSTGKIIPWLATKWKVNSNATEFTFYLRHGVTFSDGEPFNATAVKDAYDGVDKLGALSLLGVGYMVGYEGTTVVNPYEVQVKFKAPDAQFLQATATTVLGILSPKSYTKYTAAQRCLGHFWGSGPFTLKSFTPGVSAQLDRRADYAWPSAAVTNKGAPYLNSITAKWITEDSVLVGSLTSGTLDLAWPRNPLSSAEQAQITGAGGSIFSRAYPGISDILVPNVTAGHVLADPKVRQALQESINRKQIATTVYWAKYPTVTGALESTTPYYSDESSLLAYNPSAAEKLLTADGWKVGPGGIRVKDGKKLELAFPIELQNPEWDLLQQQLKKVGIQLNQKVVTAAQLEQIYDTPGGDYDIADDYYTRGDPEVLGSILDTGVVKSAIAQQSQSAADGKTLSALFYQGNSAITPASRAAAYKKIQQFVIQQGVAFPADERLEVSGVAKTVHGLEVTNEGLLIANDIYLSNS